MGRNELLEIYYTENKTCMETFNYRIVDTCSVEFWLQRTVHRPIFYRILQVIKCQGFLTQQLSIQHRRHQLEVLIIEDNERNTVHMFNISYSTAFVLVRRVVKVMYVRLMPFVKLPDHTVLQNSMPMQFRIHFGIKCAVVII